MSDESAPRIGVTTFEVDVVRPGVEVIRTARMTTDPASQLAEVLSRVLLESPWAIVVDLSALGGLDGRAMQVLAGAARWAGELNIGYALAGPRRAVVTALQAAGYLELFEIHGSTAEALTAFGGAQLHNPV